MAFIDTYQLATMGQNSTNTFTRSVMGYTVTIVVVEEEVPVQRPGGSSTASTTGYDVKKETEKEKIKRITVTIEFNGKTYTDTAITRDLSIKVEDIDIQINESQGKPSIKIRLLD